MMLREPLHPKDSKRLIRKILDSGNQVFTKHAREEMEKDDLIRGDVINVLWHGEAGFPEMERDAWRYGVQTPRAAVSVEFASESELIVVTAWRKSR